MSGGRGVGKGGGRGVSCVRRSGGGTRGVIALSKDRGKGDWDGPVRGV